MIRQQSTSVLSEILVSCRIAFAKRSWPYLLAVALSGLWIPFVLINTGNALRVFSQVATDLAPGPAFPIMGLSGTLEVVGLGVWGIHLWKLMGSHQAPVAVPRGTITADRTVASIADEFPKTLDVFEAFGFKELRNPLLRNTLAKRVTVRMACGMKHVDEEKLLAALRKCAEIAEAPVTPGLAK